MRWGVYLSTLVDFVLAFVGSLMVAGQVSLRSRCWGLGEGKVKKSGAGGKAQYAENFTRLSHSETTDYGNYYVTLYLYLVALTH